MSKEWKAFIISERGVYDDQAPSFERYNYPKSDISSLISQLRDSIDAENPQKITELLTGHFFYQSSNRTYSDSFTGGHHKKFWEMQYFLVRPVAETLLFEHLPDFKDLLNALKDKNNSTQEAFISGCIINKDIPDTLFKPLTDTAYAQIEAELLQLQQHDSSRNLSNELRSLLEQKPLGTANPVEQLEFKLRFVETLQSKEAELADVPNYKKYIVNIAMVLLGFIPNVANWLVTGNFLFFKYTPEQEAVAGIKDKVNDLIPR